MGKKSTKREIIEWVLILGIPLSLYVTGWHTEVIGQFQRMILLTGLIAPDTTVPVQDLSKTDLDLKLITDSGQEITLREYEGKVLFLNFWATWCPPCIAELPEIQELYLKTDPNQVEFFMISVDQDQGKAREFMNRKEYTFPVYRLSGQLPQVFQAEAIPSTFVINRAGELAMKRVGMASYNNDEFIAFLEDAAQGTKTSKRF